MWQVASIEVPSTKTAISRARRGFRVFTLKEGAKMDAIFNYFMHYLL
jgi:hypothetical protein